MTTIQAFIERHPVLTYYVLTFILSWGGILLVIGGPGAIPSPSEQAMALLPVAILVMIIGPSVAGLLMTGLVHGRAGLRDLLARLLKWRVGVRWYGVALLTAPLSVLWVAFAHRTLHSADKCPAFSGRTSLVCWCPLGYLLGSTVSLHALHPLCRVCVSYSRNPEEPWHYGLSSQGSVAMLCLPEPRS